MEKEPITFLARVNLVHKGQNRYASVYDDGTAILDTGEQITLNETQIEKIKQKKKEAERQAAIAKKKKMQAQEAAKREKAEAFSSEQEELDDEDEESLERFQPLAMKRPSWKGVAAASLAYVLVVGGTLFGSTYILDHYMNKVSVAQISTSMAKDSQFTPDNLSQLKMSESVYQELNELAPGGLVLWQDAQEVVGKYIAMDAAAGQYLAYDFVSDTMTMDNPWIQGLESDTELYTIQFDPYTTYNQLLFPGAHVRMRANISLFDASGNPTGQTDIVSISAAASGVKNAVSKSQEVKNPEGEEEGEAEEQVTVTEPINDEDIPDLFDNVTVVDMLNSNNESIFDLYLPLTRMTREERLDYLKEKAKTTDAASYYSRFVPTALVFALNDEQTNELTKVEATSNASINYTVLPNANDGTEEQNSLYLKFQEVRKDVNEIFGDAMLAY